MTEENKDNQNPQQLQGDQKPPQLPKGKEVVNPKPPAPAAPPKEAKPKRVEVICEGTLGHLLLKKGAVTDDEDYVALLKTRRGASLVREVK